MPCKMNLETGKKIFFFLCLQICREISDAEKSIEDLNKAIRDKEDQLKKAQTRLEARSHRPGVELCRDIPQYK